MAALKTELRSKLEKTIIEARRVAEEGAASALESLSVHEPNSSRHMDEPARLFRKNLRARGRQLGDSRETDGRQEIIRLAHACAYEHWHRMLFARFLAENGLLIEPETRVAISLEECRELARDKGVEPWSLAAGFAQAMLPQIFRTDDPLLRVSLSREKQNRLESLLSGLETEVFLASDSLGWSYQFWQTDNKKKINASGVKIGADELPAVTQLFTEDYMVDFLLDNTLGAWWAGRILAANPGLAESAKDEAELRQAVSLPGVSWAYLRFIKEKKWRPAAGAFDGWPKTAAELKCLDPCMGSGHFIVAMFGRLTAMRMVEEKIDEKAAIRAVIRDNLFGLEIDPRCTQIAAFNLALAAWRRIGHSPLPAMHLACSGLAPMAKKDEWIALAGKSERIQTGMERLYNLFKQATSLGSLIDPREIEGDLHSADFHELFPLLDQALKQETQEDVHEMAVMARGITEAAEILSGRYILIATNVPYLGRGKQNDQIKIFCGQYFPEAKSDLATCFIERGNRLRALNGSMAVVSPQSWLFSYAFKRLRERMLITDQWEFIARLGEHAFDSQQAAGAFVTLLCFTSIKKKDKKEYFGIDASHPYSSKEKEEVLRHGALLSIEQEDQLKNPDARIGLSKAEQSSRLEGSAISLLGLGTCDYPHYIRNYWELPRLLLNWGYLQTASNKLEGLSGRENIVAWDANAKRVYGMSNEERIQGHNQDYRGRAAWGKRGIVIALMRNLKISIYSGELFDKSVAVIIPKKKEDLAAIYAFCVSDEFLQQVRKIDQKVMVTNANFTKVPFDIFYWQKVATEKYPNGLSKPFSSDPTQWLFNGHPKDSDNPLHVAVGRLLGYLWPRQTGSSFSDCPALGADGLEKLADKDGIVCIPSVRGEEPAADRLRQVLIGAYGRDWKPNKESELIRATGSEAASLDEWLRNEFFDQHCDIFRQRPFIWHIWDGRRNDGFHALVNYHKLAAGDGEGRKTLELLTHSYLNDWIARQTEGVRNDLDGAEARLLAAQELKIRLEKILEGEPPFDLFVRWKPLAKQPLGWGPDINDGVRINIRPFMAADIPGGRSGAGVLRWKPNIKWDKDRGKEPGRPKDEYPWFWQGENPSGVRVNDVHFSRRAKEAARNGASR